MRSLRLLLPLLAALAAGCGSSTPAASSPTAGDPAPSAEASAAPAASAAPSADAAAAPTAPAASASNAVPDRAPLTGKITNAKIAELVMQNQELFNDCYSIGAGKSKSFVGTVTVKATIGPSGEVHAAEIVKSTAKNKKVDQCVLEAFKKMKFPATGSTVPITFPMEFNGVEEVK